MPKEAENSTRLQQRAEAFKTEINKLDKKGFRLEAAVKLVAEKYFLSEATVYKDYYK